MKTTHLEAEGAGSADLRACLASCGKGVARIRKAREAILAESRRALQAPESLLRLALNEAEAAAWQTLYPHLVFPALATEKVETVAAWNARQRFVWRSSPVFMPAA